MLERLFGISGQSTLIDSAFRDIEQMLLQSSKMLQLACGALLDNETLKVDLDRMDDTVDQNEQMIRRIVLEHLSINPKQDLVASLVLASIVQDAERIGDFALGINELVGLAKSPREGEFKTELKQLVTRLLPMFELCIDAFRRDNVEKAKVVMAEHEELKKAFIDLTRRIAESDLSADMAVVYAGAARILRRVSAHLSNIASCVVQPYDKIRSADEPAG